MVNAKQDGLQTVQLQFAEGITLTMVHVPQYEYLMTTEDVANGYGVKTDTVRSHKSNHADELVEGVHFTSVEIFNAGKNANGKGVEIFHTLKKNSQPHQIYWTKAGVIRLGFFIKSERAKKFRDWAESVVLVVTAPKVELPAVVRRNHNRLTKDRLLEIMSLVALIDEKEVRTALIQKLMPTLEVSGLQLSLPFAGAQTAVVGKGGLGQ